MKYTIRTILYTILCIFLPALCLPGCTKDYGREDIAAYLKNSYGLSSFRVSSEPTEMHSDFDDCTDYLWTVTETDGTVFHVLDDYHWGMEALTNTLRDDYYAIHLINAYPDLPHGDLSLETEQEEELVSAKLAGSYSTREELRDRIGQLKTVASSPSYPGSVGYILEFDFPYRTIGMYEYTTGDVFGNLDQPIDEGDAELRFLLTCVDHRLSQLDSFSEAEIAQAVQEHPYQIGVRKTEETVFYDDLCGSPYGYGISFASLYELLIRNGYEVTGTDMHYSFTGTDGSGYEISYSFLHPTENSTEGYYYLKDGMEIDMDAYFYNHFRSGAILEMTGLHAIQYFEVNQKS